MNVSSVNYKLQILALGICMAAGVSHAQSVEGGQRFEQKKETAEKAEKACAEAGVTCTISVPKP